jgi:predicted transposase YbfD/YdcC
MDVTFYNQLLDQFSQVPDPRCGNAKRHWLLDILAITLCAVIAGADTWVEIAEFARSKATWLQTWLALPNGIPSHDTIARVFARLDPAALQTCFVGVVQILSQQAAQVIAIDGKCLRHSFDTAADQDAIYMVSAWATQQRLVFGQVKVDAKSNEITAVPRLLALLELAGCIVTLDAMGCQKAIAKQIRAQGGDYVLALKDNHPNLAADVAACFEHAQQHRFEDVAHSCCESLTCGHGRQEGRRCDLITLLAHDPLWQDVQAEWSGLRSLVRLTRTRREGSQTSVEVHYYLSSLEDDARQVANAVRSHWGIENRLHWVLDVAFREDACRIRKDHAPENLAVMRHLALNLLRRETTCKNGLKVKRSKAAWDNDYLLKVLTI